MVPGHERPARADRDCFLRLSPKSGPAQAGTGQRRVRQGGRPLRPDERPHVGRPAPAVERRFRGRAEPAGRAAADALPRCRRGNRRYRTAPAGRGGCGQRSRGRRHLRGDGRARATAGARSRPRRTLPFHRRPMPRRWRFPSAISIAIRLPSASATWRTSSARLRKPTGC